MRKKLKYSVIYSRAPGGGYTAYFPTFPEITVWYPSLAQCRDAAHDALALHLEGLQALGERAPSEGRVVRATMRVEVG